jgi:nicotinamide riboside transporter PnuC
MATHLVDTDPPPRPHEPNFDDRMTGFLGADMRLVYGIAVPVLAVAALIIVMSQGQTVWLDAVTFVFAVAALCLVVWGFMRMLKDDGAAE